MPVGAFVIVLTESVFETVMFNIVFTSLQVAINCVSCSLGTLDMGNWFVFESGGGAKY